MNGKRARRERRRVEQGLLTPQEREALKADVRAAAEARSVLVRKARDERKAAVAKVEAEYHAACEVAWQTFRVRRDNAIGKAETAARKRASTSRAAA